MPAVPSLADLLDPPGRAPKSVSRTPGGQPTSAPGSSPGLRKWLLWGMMASPVVGFAPLMISLASINAIFVDALDCRSGGNVGPVCAALNMGAASGLLALATVPLGVFAAVVLGVLGVILPKSPVTQVAPVTPSTVSLRLQPEPTGHGRSDESGEAEQQALVIASNVAETAVAQTAPGRWAADPPWEAIVVARRPLRTGVAVAGLVLAAAGVLFPFRSLLAVWSPAVAAVEPGGTSSGPTVGLIEGVKFLVMLVSYVGWLISALVSLVFGGVMVLAGLLTAGAGAVTAPSAAGSGQRKPEGSALSRAIWAVSRVPGEPPRKSLAIAGANMAATGTVILFAVRAIQGDERLATFRASILDAQGAWAWDAFGLGLPLAWAVVMVGVLIAIRNLPDLLRQPDDTCPTRQVAQGPVLGVGQLDRPAASFGALAPTAPFLEFCLPLWQMYLPN